MIILLPGVTTAPSLTQLVCQLDVVKTSQESTFLVPPSIVVPTDESVALATDMTVPQFTEIGQSVLSAQTTLTQIHLLSINRRKMVSLSG